MVLILPLEAIEVTNPVLRYQIIRDFVCSMMIFVTQYYSFVRREQSNIARSFQNIPQT
jgi:hypothetical protein